LVEFDEKLVTQSWGLAFVPVESVAQFLLGYRQESHLHVGGWTAGSRLREARGREEERLEVTRANL
jgi:hypothetical protein